MNKFNMFITAVCVLFLIKLRWPKNKSIYEADRAKVKTTLDIFSCKGKEFSCKYTVQLQWSQFRALKRVTVNQIIIYAGF